MPASHSFFRHRLTVASLLVTCGVWVCQSSDAAEEKQRIFVDPADAKESRAFQLQGEYIGKSHGLQVIARGDDQFITVIYKGGLPGAGWDQNPPVRLEEDGEGVTDLVKSLELKRVTRKSPTLGAKPPTGAVHLFDGTAEALAVHWQPGARITQDGLLKPGCTTSNTFRDYTLHLEFRLPFMPGATGQARANSGVYHQGRYETQILDSFGLEGRDNEAGGIYSLRDPDWNLCFPPLQWQTYDIDFIAARWDDNGKKQSDARITVRLNGHVVQPDVALDRVTPGAFLEESPEPGPIFLQHHGDPVRFRNIWILPRDADQEARRPIVPAFERFHAQTGADPHLGGRLLLGELACSRCHALPSDQVTLSTKSPPVLTQVGSRVRPEWMAKFLADPQGTKPGTTMPNLLAAEPSDRRKEHVRALVAFLSSTGSVHDRLTDPQSLARGKQLLNEIGCIQCHTSRPQARSSQDLVPLVDLGEKYSLDSLAQFLKNPQAVRPSGRMPGWPLNSQQFVDLAGYLVGDPARLPSAKKNLRFQAYHGSWQELPDFDKLSSVRTGQSAGFDLTVAQRANQFGIRFEGFLHIEQPGEYLFFLGSDDGSRLWIDGRSVVSLDGVHAHTEKSGKISLSAGPHRVQVDYFEQGGEESLTLYYQGPRIPRRDLSPLLTLTKEKPPASDPKSTANDPRHWREDSELVENGRKLFGSLGCAHCHQMEYQGKPLKSDKRFPSLVKCEPDRGCLAQDPLQGVPHYALSPAQREALKTVLHKGLDVSLSEPRTKQGVVAETMQRFHCHACHTRDHLGGPTRARNELFRSTIPEMGDEGRLPPPLDGVGDKLTDAALDALWEQGAKERPYMKTMMPIFGKQNVGHLTHALADCDRRDEAELASFQVAEHRVKSIGRQLAGSRGLACIKCHTFAGQRGPGIQAIDLLTMSRRLREDWFLRYMVDPNVYRPGTRMPTAYPEGKAILPDILDGDPNRQISALWIYLRDGNKAAEPEGLRIDRIELVPQDRPIIYRNFIRGLSPRGIAVGYPERCHLAWDADRMSLGLLWHRRFIDASRHWNGRGQGFQPPLGDHVVQWEKTAPWAMLESVQDPWPNEPPKQRGFRFLGYRLDDKLRPRFRYAGSGFTVEDFPEPQTGSPEGSFRRRLTIESDSTGVTGTLFFRAARGKTITQDADGFYLIDRAIRMRLTGLSQGTLLQVGEEWELRYPVDLSHGKVEIIQELQW